MPAKPYNEWGPLDYAQYGLEVFAFILIFITFCILCGSVHSSQQVKSCVKGIRLYSFLNQLYDQINL